MVFDNNLKNTYRNEENNILITSGIAFSVFV